MEQDAVLYKQEEGVATVTLNRPENANCLCPEIVEGLKQASEIAMHDREVRAMVLTGTGKFFCAGGDLSAFESYGETLQKNMGGMVDKFHAVLTQYANFTKPVIVAINGTAAGGGLSLALMADYIIAGDNAKLTMAYTNAGLSPDGGASYYLARHIGLLRAKELMIMNRVLSADEAMAWGMVSETVPESQLMSRTQEVAGQLAIGATQAYGAVKQLLMTAYSQDLENQLASESSAMVEAVGTQDASAGIKAFLNKQKPEFTGE